MLGLYGCVVQSIPTFWSTNLRVRGRAKEDVHSTVEAFLCLGQEGEVGLSEQEVVALDLLDTLARSLYPRW